MKILFTFDYELFLGPDTGTVENCLIRPTEHLGEIARVSGAHFVFFIDVLYLLKLKEYINDSVKVQTDFYKVYNQLVGLHREGHDLELHIHPQWFYSSYNINEEKWNLDFKHYKLADCPEDDVERMIVSSCDFLREITGGYPIAYRAGGYSAPATKNYWELLYKKGIKYDSSVIMGEKSETPFQSYDYSSINTPVPYAFSSNNADIDPNGFLLEFPISSFQVSRLFRAIIEKPLIKLQHKNLSVFGDGKGVGFLYKSENRKAKKHGLLDKISLRSTIDFRNAVWVKHIITKGINNNYPYLVFIGHPKNQTEYSLYELERLLKKKQYANKVITFRNIL